MPIFEEVRTVTAAGRLVIPWVIQRALGLDHGGRVLFRVENGAVTLLSAERLEADPGEPASGEKTPVSDSKDALMTELRTLLDAADRDRSAEASDL
jgi:bifunctional DNA-binding transcriptional regulator/antitoxin component of YhaV-PrlF toxin-antitoxin module